MSLGRVALLDGMALSMLAAERLRYAGEPDLTLRWLIESPYARRSRAPREFDAHVHAREAHMRREARRFAEAERTRQQRLRDATIIDAAEAKRQRRQAKRLACSPSPLSGREG